MKKHVTFFWVAVMLVMAGLSLQAQDKLGADDFLKYVDANKASIPYTKIEKTIQGDVLTVKIFCPKEAQDSLLQAIEKSAQVGYAFEGLDAGQVVCSVEFKIAQAKEKPAAKSVCPSKVTVLTETLKAETFVEYRDFSGPALPETVAVKSPSGGSVSGVKVAVGSLVEKDQELLALNAGVNDEIKALEQEAQRKKKILTARQNWAVKSEKAIQSAEKDYQKTLALLEEKRAQAAQIVRAPLAGTVRSLTAAAGVETAVDAVLLEISSDRQMLVQMPLTAADAGLFSPGEKISGIGAGKEELSAEIVAVSAEQLTLRLDNGRNLVKPGESFSIRKRIGEHADALVVPSLAMAKDSLGDYVFVAEKNKAKKTYVTPGASVDGRTMILKGLAPQAQLVVSGFECLAAGKKLRVISQEQLAREKAESEAKLQKKQAEAAAGEEAAAKKEKEKQEKLALKKAEADAKLQKKQAEAAAREEAKAKKEKEKLEKQSAAKAEKEPVAQAEEEKKETEIKAGKEGCAKRVTVLAEAVQPETFVEYRYHSAPLSPEVMEITSAAAGQVAAVKVGEGSLVEKGQELVLVFAARNEEIVKLQQEAARKKKILAARQNAKAPSAKAIQAAERDYQNTVSLLEQKTAQVAQAVVAPVAGTVLKLKVAAGDEVLSSSVLLEIVTEEFLQVKIPLSMAESGEGQIVGRIAGLEGDRTARIRSLSDSQLLLRLDNAGHAIKAGSIFTVRKLKTEYANAVVVPAAALFKDSLGDFVYVVEKKKAKKTYVGVGPREADRILIKQGLAPGMPLILSGFECLADGKKISMVTGEDLAREQAQAMGVVRPAAEGKPGRLKIGVHGTYFLMLGENFKNTYLDLSGFGGELSFRLSPKLDIWLSGGLAMKKNTPAWSSDEMSFQMIPLTGAVRYYLYDSGNLSAYVGAGPNFFMVNDKNPVADIKTNLIGFNAMAGAYYKLSRKFSLQLMTKFNMVKKDVVPDSETDTPLDLNGLEVNLGIAFSL